MPPHEDIERIKRNAGRRIAEARRAAGLSQAALATRIKRTQQFVNLIEKGEQNLTLDTLVRVANGVGCRARELLDDPADVSDAQSKGRASSRTGSASTKRRPSRAR